MLSSDNHWLVFRTDDAQRSLLQEQAIDDIRDDDMFFIGGGLPRRTSSWEVQLSRQSAFFIDTVGVAFVEGSGCGGDVKKIVIWNSSAEYYPLPNGRGTKLPPVEDALCLHHKPIYWSERANLRFICTRLSPTSMQITLKVHDQEDKTHRETTHLCTGLSPEWCPAPLVRLYHGSVATLNVSMFDACEGF